MSNKKIFISLFYGLQNIEERSYDTTYITLSDHSVQVEQKVASKKVKRVIGTKLVCVISNWHFNKELHDSNSLRACKPSDVNVALKFSSSEFINDKNRDLPYHFDKSGVVLPFAAFVSLLKDKMFTDTFMQQLKKKFEETEGPLDLTDVDCVDLTVPPPPLIDPIDVDNEDEEEAEEEVGDEIEKKRKKKAASATTIVDDDDEIPDFNLPAKKSGKRGKRGTVQQLDGE